MANTVFFPRQKRIKRRAVSQHCGHNHTRLYNICHFTPLQEGLAHSPVTDGDAYSYIVLGKLHQTLSISEG